MQTQTILNVIDVYWLLGIGILLLGLEATISSFMLIWFGIGFIITAIVTIFYEFSDGIWQLSLVAILSIFQVIILRKKMLEKFLRSEENIDDNFFNEEGIGEIRNTKVFYKGTYWEQEPEVLNENFEDGEKVLVKRIYRNIAIIKKK